MLVPVVLAGGAGTRLWPVSREGHPKPFMCLGDGESLLLKTYRRAAGVASAGKQSSEIITVTNRDYFFMSKDEFMRAKVCDDQAGVFLLEPFARNTAPAVALAAHYVAEKFGRNTPILVLAADHLIQDQPGFAAAVAAAAALALQDKLVTFGVIPSEPESGYGYIEAGEAVGAGKRVIRFIEKPSIDRAREYITAGNFLWNSGMFCFKAGAILDEMSRHAPEVAAATKECWALMHESGKTAKTNLDIPAKVFENAPNISIDYAVMERSDRGVVVPVDVGWSDIGSWGAVRELVQPDADNNRAIGEAIFVDSRNTYVQSDRRLVATVGVDNLIIVDTPDALLVAHPDKAQDVKKIVSLLKSHDHEAYRLHRTVVRPWGTYTVLGEGGRFKIKRIEVKPGASLSLQMHHHRSEHWIVVSGMARVVNGERELFIATNESTYIPAGHTHRLENPGLIDLIMIEVQSGEYLGEDDIVRFDDMYGRTDN